MQGMFGWCPRLGLSVRQMHPTARHGKSTAWVMLGPGSFARVSTKQARNAELVEERAERGGCACAT